jgi:hypothetical protein
MIFVTPWLQMRLYRLAQEMLDSALYHMALRCTDELFYLFNSEAEGGAIRRGGRHFPRPPNLRHAWCYLDMALHMDVVPGEGSLFSLKPTVDYTIDFLNSMHNASISLCVSLRRICECPLVVPFVEMAMSVRQRINFPSTEIYTYSDFLDDCVKNAILLGSTSATWQATADAQSQFNANWAKKILANQVPYSARACHRLCEPHGG